MKPIRPELLHIDEDLLVVHKPSGLLTIPDRFRQAPLHLQGWLEATHGKVWVVHRLDRETSGVICFARNEEAHRHLSMQFADRQVDKHYRALIEGKPFSVQGVIEEPIGPHPTRSGQMAVLARGKPAITHYQVLEVFRAFSWVDARILTGRTHQIRVHFQSIGHPLAVDALYGRRAELYLSEIKTKNFRLGRDKTERPLLHRIALHAYEIGLLHPADGRRLQFTAPLPKDLAAVLKQLRKWGK